MYGDFSRVRKELVYDVRFESLLVKSLSVTDDRRTLGVKVSRSKSRSIDGNRVNSEREDDDVARGRTVDDRLTSELDPNECVIELELLFIPDDVYGDASVDVGRDDGAERLPFTCIEFAADVDVDVDGVLPLVPRS